MSETQAEIKAELDLRLLAELRDLKQRMSRLELLLKAVAGDIGGPRAKRIIEKVGKNS